MRAKHNLGTAAMLLAVLGLGAAHGAPGGPQGRDGDRPHGGPAGGPMCLSEGRPANMGHPPMGVDLVRAKQAGATEAQIQTLADFQLEQQTQRIDLQASADKTELKLEALLKAGNTDEKAILQAVDAINHARGDIFKLEISSMLKAKQVLGEAVLRKMHERPPPPDCAPSIPGVRWMRQRPQGDQEHPGGRGGDKQSAERDEGRIPAPDESK